MAGQAPNPNYAAKWFKINKLRMQGKNTDGTTANLSFEFSKNNPALLVWTGLKGDNKPIRGAMDSIAMAVLLEALKECINFIPAPDKPKIALHLENMRMNWKPGGGKPDGTVTDTRIIVGKDEKGVIFIAISQHGRETIKFPFGFSEYPHVFHRLLHSTGEQMSPAEVSVLVARARVELWNHALKQCMFSEFDSVAEEATRGGGRPNNNGGGNGGGYNGGGGNNGGSNAPSNDDDFPF